jgi:cytochrome c556
MRRLTIGVLALAVGVASTAAVALTDDPITTRKKLMQANGGAAGLAGGMIEGEIEFNADAATAAIRTMNAVAYSFGDYFPEGSHEGETRASPKIWEEMEEFQQYLADFRADTDAARGTDITSVEQLQAAMSEIGPNCQQCHEEFREEN